MLTLLMIRQDPVKLTRRNSLLLRPLSCSTASLPQPQCNRTAAILRTRTRSYRGIPPPLLQRLHAPSSTVVSLTTVLPNQSDRKLAADPYLTMHCHSLPLNILSFQIHRHVSKEHQSLNKHSSKERQSLSRHSSEKRQTLSRLSNRASQAISIICLLTGKQL